MAVKTYFIAGFLGSGKTTLLNNLLQDLTDKKAVVIINEFGQINIDAKLIKCTQEMEIAEINNGSIFCSCLSGSFVKAIIEISKYQPDILLVESSGMSRPGSIAAILEELERQKKGVIDYQGMITLIDASNFLKLVETVNAVREQVVYSDLVIINKTDLAEEDVITEIENRILSLNPGAEIIKTRYARVPGNILEQKYYVSAYQERKALEDCGSSGGMFKVLLETGERLQEEELYSFIRELAPTVFRIKGLVQTDDNIVHVDYADENIRINKLKKDDLQIERSRLVFISNNRMLRVMIEKLWQERINKEYSIRK
ncbi:MAG: GTP-binding protein [Halanaerobiaceae bacterium]|jgi:G3E family GTPase|nr:GTP-binding protein [Halanaerobiaceae bacterium]